MQSPSVQVRSNRRTMANSERQPLSSSSLDGMRRTMATFRALEWTVVGLTASMLLTAIGLTCYRLYTVVTTQPSHPDFTFTIVIIFSSVFCGFYLFHGIMYERQFEIYALIASEAIMVLYCLLEYSLNGENRSVIKVVRLVIAASIFPFSAFFSYRLAKRFGYLEFRIVGASEVLQGMFRQTELYRSLLLFDLQAVVIFLLLSMSSGTNSLTDVDVMLTIIIGPVVSLMFVCLGCQAVKRESLICSAAVVIVSIALPTYVGYRFYQLYQLRLDWRIDNQLKPLAQSFYPYLVLVAGCVCLAVRGCLLIDLRFCVGNFGLGLKERVFSHPENAPLLGAIPGRYS